MSKTFVFDGENNKSYKLCTLHTNVLCSTSPLVCVLTICLALNDVMHGNVSNTIIKTITSRQFNKIQEKNITPKNNIL